MRCTAALEAAGRQELSAWRHRTGRARKSRAHARRPVQRSRNSRPELKSPSAPTPGSKPKTTLPKIAAGGFKLPPSSLLHRADEQQAIDADELKLLAQVLTEKYAEFDVHGQVTQINPGPVVTTFEFKPEAGIKYSRITNLTDDLCLALKAESILIERMAGKSTVGIQVPNREREIIWLRENIESSGVHRHQVEADARAWAKTLTAASLPPILPACRIF